MAIHLQRIEGLAEIDRVLRELPKRLAERELAGAMRKGANVIRQEMRRKVPVGDGPPHPKYGRGRDNIRVTKLRHPRGTVEFAVHTGAAFWLGWLETGLPDRVWMVHSRGARRRARQPHRTSGRLPQHRWAEPAFRLAAPRALEVMREDIVNRLDRLAKELAGPRGAIRQSTIRRL